MKNIGWFSRFLIQPIPAGALAAALLLVAAGYAAAQDATPAAAPAPESQASIPVGYTAHYSIDAGGRMSGTSGSGSMYDTLVNLHTGPRVLGESFELHALPGNQHTLVDDLSVFGSGVGGEPYNFARLTASKSRVYEFSGLFRRDRQYFDYDLLGNPGIPGGNSIPIGPSTARTGSYAWPQVLSSPFQYNTVRHMTDTSLTLYPFSKLSYRIAYSQNIFQGPSLTPSGNSVAGQEILLDEYQRNSADDFTGAVDWKPIAGTRLTYEEQIDHYKINSSFSLDPQYLSVQEPDGTKVSLLDSYQSFTPYGYSSSTGAFSPASNCNAGSMINSSTILYANPNGGPPIVDPACAVISSYIRQQATRQIFPTEIFRLQSTSIKNVSMNGDIRYTKANMNLPDYYEQFNGLTVETSSTSKGVTTITPPESEIAYGGYANAKRDVVAVDYGIAWQATKTVGLSDQLTYSDVHQPGTAALTNATIVVNASTTGLTIDNAAGNPATTTCVWGSNGTQTCTPALPSSSTTTYKVSSPVSEGSPALGAPQFNYFGQKFVTNDATVTWDATARTMVSLTYRYQAHNIAEGTPNTTSSQAGALLFTIDENGGILNVAMRPTSNWDLNGSVEMLYNDNVFTPVAPRQSQHYRIHTLYRPKSWATVSGVYNDLERHNNTNNTGAVLASSGLPSASYDGPLNHVDHSRSLSLGTELMPNEHYGVDLNYVYTDVYTATNICFQGAASVLPGGAIAPAAANSTGVLCSPVASGHGSNTILFLGRDFEDAPTQYGSAALALSPNPRLHSDLGYRVSAVNGSRFYTDAGDVSGSLVSTYQTPFLKVAWTLHPGLIWKAEYDYFGYGEGGRSGAQWCNDNPSLAVGTAGPVPVVACSSVANTAMSPASPDFGFTAPRNFHANNVVLGMHYEF